MPYFFNSLFKRKNAVTLSYFFVFLLPRKLLPVVTYILNLSFALVDLESTGRKISIFTATENVNLLTIFLFNVLFGIAPKRTKSRIKFCKFFVIKKQQKLFSGSSFKPISPQKPKFPPTAQGLKSRPF
jgi:hypothetical protein